MKKVLLLAAAALGLASAQTITPVAVESVAAQVDADVVIAKDGASGPIPPMSDSTTAQHQVVYAPRPSLPMGYGYTPRHYSDQHRLRKVKYGKARWIWLS